MLGLKFRRETPFSLTPNDRIKDKYGKSIFWVWEIIPEKVCNENCY